MKIIFIILFLINLYSQTESVTMDFSNSTWYLTKSDKSVLFEKQNAPLIFSKIVDDDDDDQISITIEEQINFQTIDGFGYSLTGGSAYVINKLSSNDKQNLLQELFGCNDDSISVSFLRISIGSSDLNFDAFTYDDIPEGLEDTTDIDLKYFSIERDAELFSLIAEIKLINPKLSILASPWSAPKWMKDNNSTMGGSLEKKYYEVYGNYFVKYIQEVSKIYGINVDFVGIQNEPENPKNNPSMVMDWQEQKDFIEYLGPLFLRANITTKILAYDHNCDHPNYPISILNSTVSEFVYGSAFHLYAGDVSALRLVHDASPNHSIYFTEQWTGSNEEFGSTFLWHIKNVIIGTMNNWARSALEWNLASNEFFEPHTNGGCTECMGAITISTTEDNKSASILSRNVGYYIIAHASKFVKPGSIRIGCEISNTNALSATAFLNEDKIIVIVENDANSDITFSFQFRNNSATTVLPAGSVATYIWPLNNDLINTQLEK